MTTDKPENPFHPKNNAKCGHCGAEGSCQIDITWRYIQCKDCGAVGPDREDVAKAWAAWNRRYVCPDMNDKKVSGGDEVKYTPRGQVKSHTQSYRCRVTEFRPPNYGYGLCGANDFVCGMFYSDEIELIESEREG